METPISLLNYAISLQIPCSCKTEPQQPPEPFVLSSFKLSDVNSLSFFDPEHSSFVLTSSTRK